MSQRLRLILLLPVMAVAPLIAIGRFCFAVMTSPVRAWRIAVGFDQLANVAFNGSEDETISSRAARARDNGRRWGCILCKFLDALDENHCEKSKGK